MAIWPEAQSQPIDVPSPRLLLSRVATTSRKAPSVMWRPENDLA